MEWFINQEHREDVTVHGGIVADEMGMGKTMTMSQLVQLSPILAPTLVLAPKSVMWQWIETLNSVNEAATMIVHASLSTNAFESLLDYCFDDQASMSALNVKHVIVTTADIYRLVKSDKKQKQKQKRPITWGRVILDEAHCIKNPRTRIHKTLAPIKAHAKWALTATPIHKSEKDLQAIAAFIGVVTNDTALIMERYLIRRLPSDDDRPDYTINNVYLEFASEREAEVVTELEAQRHHKQHDASSISIKAEPTNFKALYTEMARSTWCRQATTHIALYLASVKKDAEALEARRTVKSSKVEWLVNDLKAHDERALIFYEWNGELDIVRDALLQNDIGMLTINGAQSMQERMDVVKFFQTSRQHRVLMTQVRCAACGLNLQCASRVYLMRPFWNPAIEAQAIGRVYRRGQERDVIVSRLILRGTIDEECLAQQARKVEAASEVLRDDYMKHLLQGMKIKSAS